MTLFSFKSSAKNARRTAALTFLGVLAMFVAAGVIHAAATKEDYSLSVSPSTQNVTGTKTVTSSIALTRTGGYAKSVALTIKGVPTATTATFSPTTIAGSASSSTLTISTNVGGRTPVGNYTLTITGSDGRLSRTTTMLLAVKAPSEQNFSLTASPASRTVVAGEPTTYDVSVARSGGFSGPVTISASGLPSGATAAPVTIAAGSTTGVITVNSSATAATGSFQPSLVGTGSLDTGSTTRTASVTYIVSQGYDFSITGSIAQALVPGVTVPLNVAFNNPNSFALKVSNVSVSIEERTSATGCSGTRNLALTQLKSTRYPLTIPPGPSTLQSLGVSASDMPQVSMLNLPTNQDACKGARYNLQYTGTAGK